MYALRWHYRDVTHVLLHNAGMPADACRMTAAKLAASPSFRLLLATAPLPFQHDLVHIGDVDLSAGSILARALGTTRVTTTSGSAAPKPAPPSGNIGDSSSTPDGAVREQARFLACILAAGEIAAQVRSALLRQHPQVEPLRQQSPPPHAGPSSSLLSLYSTSFQAAPPGTLAALYCREGVCTLPGPTLRSPLAGGRRAAGSRAVPAAPLEGADAAGRRAAESAWEGTGSSRSGSKEPPWGLPPLAAHTSVCRVGGPYNCPEYLSR